MAHIRASALAKVLLVTQCRDEISQLIAAMRQVVKEGPMLAYLMMMAARLWNRWDQAIRMFSSFALSGARQEKSTRAGN